MKIIIKKNPYLILFTVILSWATWGKYIIPIHFKADDVTNILSLLFFFIVLFDRRIHGIILHNRQFFLFCGIVMTSSVSALIMFKQSLADSIIVLRHMYLQYSICLPLIALIKKGILHRKDLFQAVLSTIRFATTLYVFHYVLYTLWGISFLNISPSAYQRYGSVRFYYNMTMPVFLLCNALSNVYSDEIKLKDYYDIIIVLFLIIQVGKMRMTALSCFVSAGIGLIIAKRMGTRKAIYLIVASIAAVLVMICTSMGRDFVNILLENVSGSEDSISIRRIGRLRHISSFLKSPVFGLGYPHEKCESSMYEFGSLRPYIVNGTKQYINLSDNGIFDFLYIFGLSGVLWLVSFFGVYLKKSVQIMKKYSVSSFFIFIVAMVIDMYTELNWFFGGMLFVGIFSAFMETIDTDK